MKMPRTAGSLQVHSLTIPTWHLLFDHGAITQEVLNYQFPGSGTDDDPFIVTWIPDDSRDPHSLSSVRKISITLLSASSSLIVSLASSAYSGTVDEIIAEFHVSSQVATLGLSLYVLGFAIGPLLWAPFSEIAGRQITFFISLFGLASFLAGSAASPNITSLCILRFFAGAFGSAPLSNAGGTISDLFNARKRSLALTLYAAAPFLGPSLGPIIGGFLGMRVGWRWVQGFLAATCLFIWGLTTLFIPETYTPFLLVKRSERLSLISGRIYRSQIGLRKKKESTRELVWKTLARPLVLLLKEPAVLISSIYTAIVYGTLYMLFAAFPIVFQEIRGWNPGIGGLAFLGIMVGMIIGIICTIPASFHYMKIQDQNNGYASPEVRLLQCMPGALIIPISQFCFAWTNYPSIHWSVSIFTTAPFGLGVILIYLGIMNYLIDSYTIYAASVLAANAVLRSIFGAIFPVITAYMYDRLGIHWAPSIPAFLSLLFAPFPFLFYRYGATVRQRCRYATESDDHMQNLRALSMQEMQEMKDIPASQNEASKGLQRVDSDIIAPIQ